MFRWLFNTESSQPWFPIETSITYIPAIPYLLLAGAVLGLFFGILSRMLDQQNVR